MLLNNLNLSTSYNLDADGVTALAWSPVRVSTGAQFFENKLNANLAATLDPYAIDNSGRKIQVVQQHYFFRFCFGRVLVSYFCFKSIADADS